MTALIRRAAAALRTPDYPVRSQAAADPEAAYPLDMSVVTRRFTLAADGVVVVPGPGARGYHNPVSVSLYALGQHALIRPPGEAAPGQVAAARDTFLVQARYLRASQDPLGGWRYPVPVPRYGVAPGWYSAMAQGLAASVLLRAAGLTGEASYRDAAAAAVGLLLTPLDAGGCSHYDDRGRPFPEECPADPPAHILNGAVFALTGLAEYEAQAHRSGNATRAVARRLADGLPGYDLGYWSRYDLRFQVPATLAYHSLHISLLRLAGQFFPGHGFAATADRWTAQRGHPAGRLRAAAGKAAFVLGEAALGKTHRERRAGG